MFERVLPGRPLSAGMGGSHRTADDAVHYTVFFGARSIVFTTLAMRVADLEEPGGATRRAALIAFCSNGWS